MDELHRQLALQQAEIARLRARVAQLEARPLQLTQNPAASEPSWQQKHTRQLRLTAALKKEYRTQLQKIARLFERETGRRLDLRRLC